MIKLYIYIIYEQSDNLMLTLFQLVLLTMGGKQEPAVTLHQVQVQDRLQVSYQCFVVPLGIHKLLETCHNL